MLKLTFILFALLSALVVSSEGFCHVPANAGRQYSHVAQSRCNRPALVVHAGRKDDQGRPIISRPRKVWRKIRRGVMTFAVLAFMLHSNSAVASMRPMQLDVEVMEEEEMMQSIRPFATEEEADLAVEGILIEDEFEESENVWGSPEEQVEAKTSAAQKKPAQKQQKKKRSLYGDDEDDEEFEDIAREEETMEKAGGRELSTKAGSAFYEKKKESPMMYVKAFFLFTTLPVCGLWYGEFWRMRNEQRYVKKAIKIQKMQRAQYLNSTKTNSTKTESDDDDDDDDDDDETEDDNGDDTGDSPPSDPKKPTDGDDEED